jgi:hypothetical protein
MSNLRQAAQQALEALEIGHDSAQAEADQYHTAMAGYRPERHAQMDADVQQIANAITALRAALAEPASDYERGFVDGMNLQTKGSVDKAVNRMAQTTHWEGCEAVHPDCKEKA